MISFIVPTNGRRSVEATVASIETWPGDEIIVVGKIRPTMRDRRPRYVQRELAGGFGGSERNTAMAMARCQYLSFMDDDDVYTPGSRKVLDDAIKTHPGAPLIFRMQFPCGITLWNDKEIRCGNVGTPMIVVPNRPTMLGQWSDRYEGDLNFLETAKWLHEDYVWCEEIIASLGHDAGVPAELP